jgi:hypothetical protein
VPAATSAYHQILETHRTNLVRLSEHRGVDRLKKLYDRSQEELAEKLRRTAPGRRTSFTAHQQRALLAQVQQGQAVIAARLAGEAGDISRDVQVESLRGLSTWLGRMEKHYGGADIDLPIDEAARFWGVIDRRRSSLLKQHATSMTRYGSHLVGKMEEELGLATMQGETVDGAIGRVMDTAQVEWWKAEQIVRTEWAWAYNATHYDGIEETAKEIEDLYSRWVEHVSDSGQPLDDRVGADSLAMHGQVARPGELFVMPRDPRVSPKMWGKTWQFPPDRPNDRAVLAAWRPHWGGFAYQMRGGRRIPFR